MTDDKPRQKTTNPYFHFIKLLIADLILLWILWFIFIMAAWFLFGARLGDITTSVIILTLILIFSSLLFHLKHSLERENTKLLDVVKLRNYKLILMVNLLLYLFMTVGLIFYS